MKVAVYTIAKNEEKHVERWYESAKDADYLIIADTGSTDRTVEIAKNLGITVYSIHIDPWRFDDARNASLALVPKDVDYCIALDMDEVLSEGWKWQLKKAFDKGVTKPVYTNVHAVDKDGIPIMSFDGFKIHTRSNVRWVYPIHEVPQTYDRVDKSEKVNVSTIHMPDEEKSRSSYLPMLEKCVVLEPDVVRHKYYLAREYFYAKRYEEAADFFLLYIDKSIFPEEKASAYHMLAQCEPEKAEHYLLLAIDEYQSRETYLLLADHYHKNKEWEKCLYSAKKSLEYDTRSSFTSIEQMWGHMPQDLIAVSSWRLGDYEQAYEYGKKALDISPTDERLQNNLKFYQEKINGNTN